MAHLPWLRQLLKQVNRRIKKADHGTTRRRRLMRKRDELRRAYQRARRGG